MAVTRALVVGVAALALGCLRDARPLRCDARGDAACNAHAGGRCVAGYCARPAAGCASGFAYTESAALPGACVPDAPPVDAATDAPPDAVADAPTDVGADAGDDAPAPADAPEDAALDADAAADAPPDAPPDAAPLLPPQLRAPLSGARAMTEQPTLRWEPPTIGATVRLQLCDDRACTVPVREVVTAVDGYVTPPLGAAAARVRWWRARTEVGARASAYSPTWQHTVATRRGGARDLSWGVVPDYDGDGRADGLIGGGATSAVAYALQGNHTAAVALAAPPGVLGPRSFGVAVAPAGDVNGDGYVDALVGAPATTRGTVGAVVLYLGSPTGLGATAGVVVEDPRRQQDFGAAVAAAGDVNDDGYADVAVGAPGAGMVSFLLGSREGLRVGPTWDRAATTQHGRALAAGDFNGDGRPDLAAGGAGEVHQRLNGATPTTRMLLGPPGTGAGLGGALNATADLNGDSTADLVATAGSQVVIFYGAASGEGGSSALIPFRDPIGGAAGLIDVDRDGIDDLGVAMVTPGTVAVHRGTAMGPDLAAAYASPSLGSMVAPVFASIGDTDGDRGGDLVAVTNRGSSVILTSFVGIGSTLGLLPFGLPTVMSPVVALVAPRRPGRS